MAVITPTAHHPVPHSQTPLIAIARYADVFDAADVQTRARAIAEIDAIFFAASNTKTFADEAARAAFRERWLGRYLAHDRQFAWLATTQTGAVVGFIVGAIDDPAHAVRFADIAYFKTFADVTALYPAHLHVNLRADHQGYGIGGRLIEAFARDAIAAGAPGMHVVTSADARNVGFYHKMGFEDVARTGRGANTVVMLGRKLKMLR